jgi:hypothetical protein
MSTPVIFQIACNSFKCLLTRTPFAVIMHLLMYEILLDFVQDLFSKAFGRGWAILIDGKGIFI